MYCNGSCQFLSAPGATGQPCAGAAPKCRLGNYCDSAGTCRAKIAVSGACTSYPADQCVAGAGCQSLNYPYTCQPKKNTGESCDLLSGCLKGLTCVSASPGFVCRPGVKVGQDCTSSFCSDGSLCLGSGTKTCVALTVGDDCTGVSSSAYCWDGSYCLGTTTKTCTFGSAAVDDGCVSYSGTGQDPTRLCAPVTRGSVTCDSSNTCKILGCY